MPFDVIRHTKRQKPRTRLQAASVGCNLTVASQPDILGLNFDYQCRSCLSDFLQAMLLFSISVRLYDSAIRLIRCTLLWSDLFTELRGHVIKDQVAINSHTTQIKAKPKVTKPETWRHYRNPNMIWMLVANPII